MSSRLPALPGMILRAAATAGRRTRHEVRDLGHLANTFDAAPLDRGHLRRYVDHFGGFHSGIPLPYLYLLAQRAQLAVMLDRRFPFAIPGLVHIANDLCRVETPRWEQPFSVGVTVGLGDTPDAAADLRPMFHVDIQQAGRTVVTCTSTYLARRGRGRRSRPEPPATAPAEWQELQTWTLPASAGRHYARLSGDFNPIHLHPWLSRWFGFRSPLIHGMYSVGRVVAAIEARQGMAVLAVSARFRRPLLLPGEARLLQDRQGTPQGRFQLISADGQTIHLEGCYEAA